jgi:hypothetical protein
VASYDRSKPLVIDPVIAYSTFLGGATESTSANAVAAFTDPVTSKVYSYVAGGTCASAIHESRLLVLVFSAGANQSPQVLREVERAVSRALPIIPLRIENVPPSAAMEYYISSRHWLDALSTPLEQHLVQLADTLKLLLSRMPDSSAPPAPVRAVKPVPPVAVEEPLAPPSLPLAPLEARSPQPSAAAPSAEPVLSSVMPLPPVTAGSHPTLHLRGYCASLSNQ